MPQAFRPRSALLPLLLVLVFSLGLFLGQNPPSRIPVVTTTLPQEEPASFQRVNRVIDGDTVVMENGEHVRYLGLDAPELGKSYSLEAKKENGNLVLGRSVRLELDAVKKDKYGRTLAYLWQGSVLVNEKLLADGLAKILIFGSGPELKYQARLRSAEAKAQKEGRGLWR